MDGKVGLVGTAGRDAEAATRAAAPSRIAGGAPAGRNGNTATIRLQCIVRRFVHLRVG